MAENNTKYIIEIGAELGGVNKTVQALSLLKKAFAQVGENIDDNSKVLSLNASRYTKNGQALLGLSGAVKDTDGKIKSFSASFKNLRDNISPVENSVKVTTGVIGQFGKSAESAGLSLGSLIQRAFLVIPIWLSLRAVFTATIEAVKTSIKFFIDFESTLAQVQIVGNSTKEEIKLLGDESLKLASKFGISFGDLGDALTIFAQQGFSANEILKLLGPTLEFSLVSGRKVGEVVQDLVAIQTSFNLKSEDTVKIYDSISAAQLKYAITTAQLSAALRKLSPVTASLGLSLQETEGLIVALQEQTRQSGEAVATAIESIFGRLESIDTVGNLQAFTKIPLFLDEAGKATAEFTGRTRPAKEILALLADAFANATQAEKAHIAVLLGGRTRFSEAAALLNNYKTSVEGTFASLFSFNATQNASNTLLGTTKVQLQQLNDEALKLASTLKDPALAILKGGIGILRGGIGLASRPVGSFGGIGLGIEDIERQENQINDAVEKSIALEEKRKQKVNLLADTYIQLLNVQDEFNKREEAAAGTPQLAKIQADKLEAIKVVREQINELLKGDKSLPIRQITGDTFDDIAKEIRPNIVAKDKAITERIAQQEELRKNTEAQDKKQQEVQNSLKDKEVELTQQGKSRIAIVREQLRLLKEQEALDGGSFSKSLQDKKKQLEIEENEFIIKKKIALEDLRIENSLKVAKTLGENEVQIQQRIVEFARQRAIATGDETEFLKEQVKLEGIILSQIQQSSDLLRNSVKDAFSSLITGESDLNQFFDNITKTMKDKITDAFSTAVTDKFFQITGIGQIFGTVTSNIQNAFNGGANTASPILSNAIVHGATLASPILSSAISNSASQVPIGAPVGGGVNVGFGRQRNQTNKTSGSSGGLLGSLFGLFDSKGNTGVSNTNFSDGNTASSIFGQLLGTIFAFQSQRSSAKRGDVFGSTLSGGLAGASAGGPILGALGAILGFSDAGSKTKNQGLSNAFGLFQHHRGFLKNFFDPIGLFNIFKKPKRTVDIQEETKNIQVASRIDVTNKKLDVVNRNLVAIKNSIETYILPDSAYFSTKRNLEDNFALNQRRGLG